MSSPSADCARRSRGHYLGVWFLVFLVVGGGATAVVWLPITPKTRVMGLVHVPLFQDNPLAEDSSASANLPYSVQIQREAVRFTSGPLPGRVAMELEDRDLEFFKNRKVDTGEIPSLTTPTNILEQAISDGTIEAQALENTDLIQVNMVSRRPDEAKLIVNTFLSCFVTTVITSSNEERQFKLERLKDIQKAMADEMRRQRMRIQEVEQRLNRGPNPSSAISEQLNAALLAELTELRSQKIALETQIEFLQSSLGEPPDPNDLGISPMRRREYVQADSQVKALTTRIADLEIALLEAGVAKPNETKCIEAKLDALASQLDRRVEDLNSELPKLLADEHRTQLEDAKAELRHALAYEKKLREQMDQPIRGQSTRMSMDLYDLGFQIRLDEEMYEKLARRIRAMELERKLAGPAAEVFSPASIEGQVERRWLLTGIVLACAAVLSLLLTIAEAGLVRHKRWSNC